MHNLMTTLFATAAILGAGTVAGAAPVTGSSPLPLGHNYSSIEKVACWCGAYRCACGHPYVAPYAYHPYVHPYVVHPYVRPYRYNY